MRQHGLNNLGGTDFVPVVTPSGAVSTVSGVPAQIQDRVLDVVAATRVEVSNFSPAIKKVKIITTATSDSSQARIVFDAPSDTAADNWLADVATDGTVQKEWRQLGLAAGDVFEMEVPLGARRMDIRKAVGTASYLIEVS